MFQLNLIDIFKEKFIDNYENFIYDERKDLWINRNEFITRIIGTKNQLLQRVNKRSRVCCEISNSLDEIIIYFACQIADLIFVPFNKTILEIKDYIEFISPALIVYDKKDLLYEDWNGISINECVVSEKKIDTNSLITDKNKISDMFMTSGTTGQSKSIEMSLSSRIYSTYHNCIELKHTEHDIHYCVLPMLHTAAWAYHIWPSLLTASKLIISDKFHNSVFWDSIIKYDITFVQLVPTILSMLMNSEKQLNTNNKLKFIGCGSSILSTKIKHSFEERFNIPILNQYGLSEICSTHVSKMDDSEEEYSTANVGYSISGVETIIMNNDNEICKENETGEVRIKGPVLLNGYFKNDDLSFIDENGFFKTGDIGFLDNKKRLYIVDRLKDIIIKGGKNIIPSEIENVILSANDIDDICVFSANSDIYGEEIYAAVVNKEKVKLNLEILPDFMRPKEIFYIEKMPIGFSGKKLRRILKSKMQKGEFDELIG